MKRSEEMTVKPFDWDGLPTEIKFQVLDHLSIVDLARFMQAGKQSFAEVESHVTHVVNSKDPVKQPLIQQAKDIVSEKLEETKEHINKHKKAFRIIGSALIVAGGYVGWTHTPELFVYVPLLTAGVVSFFGANKLAYWTDYFVAKKEQKFERILESIVVDTNPQARPVQTNQEQSANNQDHSAAFRFSLLKSLRPNAGYSRVSDADVDLEAAVDMPSVTPGLTG